MQSRAPTAVLSSAAMQLPMPSRPIAAPSQPLSDDRFVTQQQRHLWPNEDEDTVALAVSRLKSAAQPGNVPKLPLQRSKVASADSEAAPDLGVARRESSKLGVDHVGLLRRRYRGSTRILDNGGSEHATSCGPGPASRHSRAVDFNQARRRIPLKSRQHCCHQVPSQLAKDDEIARLKAQLEISNAEIARLLGTATLSEDAARETQQTSTPPVLKEQTPQSSQVASAQDETARVSTPPEKKAAQPYASMPRRSPCSLTAEWNL